MGLALLLGVSIVNRFSKNSMVSSGLFYGFLFLLSLLVLYDVQRLIKNAKKSQDKDWDPIKESIHIYLDAINIFAKIWFFFSDTESKKKRDVKKKK